jgi:hypothetical protein
MPFVAGRRGIIVSHTDIGGKRIMTTPNGTPTGAEPARPRGGSSGDAAVQASATGSEAKVFGSNQDRSPTGAADATSATQKMKQGFSTPPSTSDNFTSS